MKKFGIISSVLLMFPAILVAQTIIGTQHNLSVTGPGTVTATSESEICVFCHTPHSSKPSSPLWNKSDIGTTYTLYNSSTTNATIGQPDGSAVLCLSCHDGTIALGNVISRTVDIDFSGGVTTMPIGNTNLSTDLSDDHPISFVYSSALAASDGQLRDPASITVPVTLENSKVQCVSCHDPHNNAYTDFLVASTQNSDLCVSCHDRNYWTTAIHRTSASTWNGSGTDPWFHTPYTTVSDNACENCHNPHNSVGNVRLLKYDIEENNCLDCHNANVAAKNIETQVSKTYNHNVYTYFQVHDANETTLSNNLHVECEDCHNPHAARNSPAVAPNVNGFIEGTRGINQAGAPVAAIQYQYELCYRCHADSPSKPIGSITRQIEQSNTRFEFDNGNPSYHPVADIGVNPNVPSLIAPLTISSIIYCTDCHASDGAGSPAGPHGSIYPQIMKYQYETADWTPESASSYELCYSCHSRSSILNDDSFKEHDVHVRGDDIPCSSCHDAHGISSSQGNIINNSHLINFDLSIVSPDNMGRLRFEDQGTFKGRCYLNCHGKKHEPRSY